MTRFAANISMLFKDRPFTDRPAAAASFGFDTIEMWWPRQVDLADSTHSDFRARIHRAGLSTVLLNFDAGDMARGDRGMPSDPDRVSQFRENVPTALAMAEALGCRKVNALAGNRIDGVNEKEQRALLADSVAFAADAAAKFGMQVLIEPLNALDNPRYLLPSTASALELIADVDLPNVQLQLDLYHAAMGGEDILDAIAVAGPRLGHVQIADVPGRHEPGSGRLPIRAILDALVANGYTDAIGLEYVPQDFSTTAFDYLLELGWNPRTQEPPTSVGDIRHGSPDKPAGGYL